MGKCTNHPDRETRFECSKYNIHMCEDCIKCRDPKLYCKFRTACPIWFMQKEKGELIETAEEPVQKAV